MKEKKIRSLHEYVILRDGKNANHETFFNSSSGYDTILGFSLARKSLIELEEKYPESNFELIRLREYVILNKEELRIISGYVETQKNYIDDLLKENLCGEDEHFYAQKDLFLLQEKLKFMSLYVNYKSDELVTLSRHSTKTQASS